MTFDQYQWRSGDTDLRLPLLNPADLSDGNQSLLNAAWLEARSHLEIFILRHEASGGQVAALRQALPNADPDIALPLLHALAVGVETWPMIIVLAQDEMPGGLAGYDALAKTLLLSEAALVQEAVEPGVLARLLVEEIGHHLDALTSPIETQGDEGTAFASLVLGVPLRVPTDSGEGLGFALLDGEWRDVELASVNESGGYEGSQQQLPLEGTLDNEISYNFDFYGIPDRLIIRYDGSTIVDTGFVSNSRTDTVMIKRGTANFVDVIVATADEGTAWQYSLSSKEAGLPDTSPLRVVAVDGKFEDADQDGTFELSGGTVQLGRKDGVAVLLRIEGGKVELSKDTLTVTGANVYAAAGGANDLMFKGSFSMPYKTGEAAGLNVTDVYKIGGLDTDLDGFIIKPNEVRFDTSFEMPYQVCGYAVNGDPIRVDTLVLGSSGLRMGGPSGTVVLPVGGEYNLLELFKVETTNHFISYDSPQDLIKYQSKFSIEAPIKGVDTKVEVDLSGENFIQIKNGKPDLKGSIKLETEVPLKIVTFKGFQLDIDTTKDPDTVEGTASVEFPWRTTTPEVDLTLGFALDPIYINSVGFKVDDLNLMMGRPDVYLQKVNLKVENTAPKVEDPVTVSGGVGFTYGPQITIGDDGGDSIFDIGKVYIARVDLEAKINVDSLAGEGTLALISDSIIKVTGGITLNWKDGYLQGDGEIVYLEGLGGGIATGTGQVKIDNSFNFSSYGGANVRLPEVSVLGPLQGVSLGAGKAQVAFTNNGNYSDDYIAAWGILPQVLPLVGGGVVGLRVEFDGSIERIGMSNLPPAPSSARMTTATAMDMDGGVEQMQELSAVTASPEQFEVTGQHRYFLLFLTWSGDPLLDPDLVVTRPDGSKVSEANFAANGMYVVPELGGNSSVAVAIGPVGGSSYVDQGLWGISAVNEADLGDVTGSALLPVVSNDAVQVNGVNVDNDGIEIGYTASSDDSDARVMLFYDDDNEGFDGTPIVTDLGVGVGASHLWVPDLVTPDNYYVYAGVMSKSGVPIFDYFETPIAVDRSVDVAVRTSLKDIRVKTEGSYYSTSVTYDIAVENLGTRSASDVKVNELFDLVGSGNDAVYSYYYINDGQYNYESIYNQTGFNLDFGDVAAGTTETTSLTLDLSYWIPVPVGGLEIAHHTAVASDGFDSNMSNNFDDGKVTFYNPAIEPTQTQGTADLLVTLMSSEGGNFVGDDATYTLQVTNHGPDLAPAVSLNEYLSGLTNYDVTVNGVKKIWSGSASQQSVLLGDMAAGAIVDVVVSGRAFSAGLGFSSSEVTSAAVIDPNESNNSLTHTRDVKTVSVSDADISLTGQPSSTSLAVGDTVTFELTVMNKGPNVASSIVVKLDHSAGITLQSGSGVQGSFDPGTGLWTVGNLNPDISRTFTITAQVASLQDMFASAEVFSMSESDPDSVAGNASSNEDDDVTLLSDYPFLVLAAPEDGSSGVPLGSNIVLTFSEAIQQGTGSIVIKTDAGSVVASYDVTGSSNLSVNGNTLTINPTADLLYNTHYQVEFASGAVKDLSGNAFVGTTGYDFTTVTGLNVTGTDDNDTLTGTYGNDVIEGGSGTDTANCTAKAAAYSLAASSNGRTINGPDGSDTLTSIERVSFADANLAFDIDGNAGQAYRLYQAAFNRTPDLGGLGGWIAGLDDGLALTQAASSFMVSAEFQSLYGSNPSNEDFVYLLYTNALHRTADAGGLAYWVNQLVSGLQTRAQALVNFSESPENKASVLPSITDGILYATAAQAAGLAMGQTFAGTPGDDTFVGTVGNDTFDGGAGNDDINGGAGLDVSVYSGNRASHTIAPGASLTVSGGSEGTDTLTNVERLKFDDTALAFDINGNAGQTYRLYQAAFNRTPDQGGLSDWIRGMDSGATLQQVAHGFIGSAEFINLMGNNSSDTQFVDLMYANVLHRAADQGGYTYWLGQMQGGTTRESVLIGFSESPENQAALIGVIQDGIDYFAV